MRLLPIVLLGACTPETRLGPRGADPFAPATGGGATGTAGCASVGEAEGEYVAQGTAADFPGEGCVAAVHATAGAAGSVLAIGIDADRALVVSATDPGGRELLPPTIVAAGDAVEVVPQVTGEVLVRLAPATPSAEPWAYGLDVACVDGCDRAWTRYPLLLMHGLGGAESFGGVEYFLGVRDDLGGAGLVVRTPGVAPFAPSLERALEWDEHLDALLAEGHRKVNVIGHSQGGTDARILASDAGLARGDAIASVTSLGTPHAGTPLADLLMEGVVDGVIAPWALELGASVFAGLFGLDASDPAFTATLAQLSTPVSVALDGATPDHASTAYYSWAGHSCGILEPWCQAQQDGEVVGILLSASYLVIWPAANDGMVPVTSQHHGEFLGELPADHANEIGQFDDQWPDPFDHLAFYRSEALRLRDLGF